MESLRLVTFGILILFFVATVQAAQDYTVLRNTYRDMKKANPSIRKDSSLERAAQSVRRCVYDHDHHRSADSKVNWNGGAILSCSTPDGCTESLSNWSRNDPLQIWYQYRNSYGHWNKILRADRVGCSATTNGAAPGGVCLWCYLGID